MSFLPDRILPWILQGQQVATQLGVVACPQVVGAPQARLIVQEAMRANQNYYPSART